MGLMTGLGARGALLSLCLFSSPVWAQSDGAPNGKSPDEIAAAIAQTIDATRPQTAGGPFSIDSAKSRGNVVEVQNTYRDPVIFSRVKAGREQQQRTLTSYFCNPSRADDLRKGVVIKLIHSLADGTDQFDMTVDWAACEALVKTPTPQANPVQLAEMAHKVALAENARIESPTDQTPFYLSRTSATGGTVEVEFVIHNSDTYKALLLRNFRIPALFQGYECAQYGEFIRQGLVIAAKLKSREGAVVEDFHVDKSLCP